jgi:hypothetical protein
VIAPATMDALADVARALGFELRRAEHAIPVGVDFDRAQEQTQFALVRGGEIAFDGTARECSAFLIGWRDLRSSVLGAVRAIDTQVMPKMSGRTLCRAHDGHYRQCLLRAGHEGPHLALHRWQDESTTPTASEERR